MNIRITKLSSFISSLSKFDNSILSRTLSLFFHSFTALSFAIKAIPTALSKAVEHDGRFSYNPLDGYVPNEFPVSFVYKTHLEAGFPLCFNGLSSNPRT